MKRIALFTLIFTLLITCVPITGFGEYIEPKIIFEDTFDESVLDVPDGWKTDYNDNETYCYTQRNISVIRKAVKMVTTNENKSTNLHKKII